jgi:hypothetical protein
MASASSHALGFVYYFAQSPQGLCIFSQRMPRDSSFTFTLLQGILPEKTQIIIVGVWKF